HPGLFHFFPNGARPALVAVGTVALHTCVQQIANRFDHGIGHGDVQVAAATVEFHAECTHHHHFGGADDICKVRIHFRRLVIKTDVQDRLPGLRQVFEGNAQHHLDDTLFGRGEFTALDL